MSNKSKQDFTEWVFSKDQMLVLHPSIFPEWAIELVSLELDWLKNSAKNVVQSCLYNPHIWTWNIITSKWDETFF